VSWSGLTGGWVGEIKNGLIAAAEGALYKLTSDLTQLEKNCKIGPEKPHGECPITSHHINEDIVTARRATLIRSNNHRPSSRGGTGALLPCNREEYNRDMVRR